VRHRQPGVVPVSVATLAMRFSGSSFGALTAEGYVASAPIAAATLDARGAVGSLAAEDVDYLFGE
jgi:hypothetical protein